MFTEAMFKIISLGIKYFKNFMFISSELDYKLLKILWKYIGIPKRKYINDDDFVTISGQDAIYINDILEDIIYCSERMTVENNSKEKLKLFILNKIRETYLLNNESFYTIDRYLFDNHKKQITLHFKLKF